LIFGLVTGLVGGFTDRVKVGKASPNQGIKLSLENSLAPFPRYLVDARADVRVDWRDWRPWSPAARRADVRADRRVKSRWFSRHQALCVTTDSLVERLNGHTPFNFIKFLDQCAKLILLKKVGGGYIFIHRMLLEYFADLPVQHISAKR
jgi:hypothetical protein